MLHGLPLHHLVSYLAVAMLTVGVVFDLTAATSGRSRWRSAGTWLLIAATVSVAAITLADFVFAIVDFDGLRPFEVLVPHRVLGIAALVLAGTTISLYGLASSSRVVSAVRSTLYAATAGLVIAGAGYSVRAHHDVVNGLHWASHSSGKYGASHSPQSRQERANTATGTCATEPQERSALVRVCAAAGEDLSQMHPAWSGPQGSREHGH